MQDSDGNHLVPLPPVSWKHCLACRVLRRVQVEMILVPVTLTDEARVRPSFYALRMKLIWVRNSMMPSKNFLNNDLSKWSTWTAQLTLLFVKYYSTCLKLIVRNHVMPRWQPMFYQCWHACVSLLFILDSFHRTTWNNWKLWMIKAMLTHLLFVSLQRIKSDCRVCYPKS